MREFITDRISILSNEVEALVNERKAMQVRDLEIETRMHQLVGAIYELQNLLAFDDNATADPDHQASDAQSVPVSPQES